MAALFEHDEKFKEKKSKKKCWTPLALQHSLYCNKIQNRNICRSNFGETITANNKNANGVRQLTRETRLSDSPACVAVPGRSLQDKHSSTHPS